MKFLPIKYRQPSDTSDPRCTLYALCNLFDDQGFLLYNNVGESTSHNREVEILKKYAGVSEQVKKYEIGTIYPLAITPQAIPIQRFDLSGSLLIFEEGHYAPLLVGFASNRDFEEHQWMVHTVLVLWGASDCIVIDSKKDFPERLTHENLFNVANIHEIRVLAQYEPDKNGFVQVSCYPPESLPHIFNTAEL